MSTEAGRKAEAIAAHYLQAHGFTIIQKNWRTRWCEIDIVATKQAAVYFVEAKYRSHTSYGTGLEYITTKKLQQMHFAAEFWLSRYGGTAADYYIAAIELTGNPPTVTEWIPDVG